MKIVWQKINQNNMKTVYPTEKLSYMEWINHMRDNQKIIVSSLHYSKTTQNRIMIDEAKKYKREYSQLIKEDRKTGILFGIKHFLSGLNGILKPSN